MNFSTGWELSWKWFNWKLTITSENSTQKSKKVTIRRLPRFALVKRSFAVTALIMSAASQQHSVGSDGELYRHDGVRITHDPFSDGMVSCFQSRYTRGRRWKDFNKWQLSAYTLEYFYHEHCSVPVKMRRRLPTAQYLSWISLERIESILFCSHDHDYSFILYSSSSSSSSLFFFQGGKVRRSWEHWQGRLWSIRRFGRSRVRVRAVEAYEPHVAVVYNIYDSTSWPP